MEGCYIITPIDGSSPKIPEGILNFVILAEDPLMVWCFEQNEVMARPELKKVASGPINFGHSSLAYLEKDISNIFSKNHLSSEQKVASMAKQVILAGQMRFPQYDDPTIGGGSLIEWSNVSGHYKPSDADSLYNRIGMVSRLLPIEKYRSISNPNKRFSDPDHIKLFRSHLNK